MTYDQVIKHFGSQAAVARALNISQPSVCDWRESTVPFGRQCEIQILTDGKLRARREHDAREVEKMKRTKAAA